MQTISTSVCSGRADRFSAIETIVVGLKKGVSHSRTHRSHSKLTITKCILAKTIFQLTTIADKI